MTTIREKEAVIYARVSTKKQEIEGNGLSSQETICREYADRMGYHVVEVFCDDYSGKSANRAGIKDLLAFLKSRRKQTIVIVDDLNRLARSLRTHYAIRDAVAKAGGKLVSPKRVYADDPDDDILEIIEAAFAGEHRRKNAEQTKDRMRARVMGGYWVFQAPWGYRYERQSGGGKVLVRNEPLASIVREALEGFASGRFASQGEVKRFLEASPPFPTNKHGLVTYESIGQLLTQPLYAGYIEVQRWDVPLRKAQHEGLISLEDFGIIQDRLAGKVRAPTRKDINEDFPLRGVVCCADCGHPMTAAWSKGRSATYPYYLCRQRGCEGNGKSIARDKVEDALHNLVQSLKPAPSLFQLANEAFRDFWQKRVDSGREKMTQMRLEIGRIERKLSQVVDRLVEADSSTIVKAYEKRVEELERQKLILTEKIAKCGTPARDYQSSFQTALKFLANPWNLWESGRLEDRRAMLKLVFGGRIVFDRFEGFQTPEISLPFKALGAISGPKKDMVRPAGLEPATPSLEGSCSIQLNYGRA